MTYPVSSFVLKSNSINQHELADHEQYMQLVLRSRWQYYINARWLLVLGAWYTGCANKNSHLKTSISS